MGLPEDLGAGVASVGHGASARGMGWDRVMRRGGTIVGGTVDGRLGGHWGSIHGCLTWGSEC